RYVIPAGDPFGGKDLGPRVAPNGRDPFSGKDVQRSADDEGSQVPAPWIANMARRSDDSGASGAAVHVYSRTGRPTRPAAGANDIRANNADEPPSEPASEPEDEGDRFEAPNDFPIRPADDEHTDKAGLSPDRVELLRDVTGFGTKHFRGRVAIRPNRKNIRG